MIEVHTAMDIKISHDYMISQGTPHFCDLAARTPRKQRRKQVTDIMTSCSNFPDVQTSCIRWFADQNLLDFLFVLEHRVNYLYRPIKGRSNICHHHADFGDTGVEWYI
ncbi:hypothetical protein CY34DRAFT_324269 [Suillus luteus UH-Slu-Lm8-n1]|uniref:Uncharacterized protein n=1 Tax=Suillus luteus UH-Slu-Lm8-n1 TaxID=930992 RepID=A0A0C9ZPM6_9AGAM|nr:hypothetical protein CY34DRAFT_324269 [Suillus luteus UH-Slu-Lm8-n1]